VVDNPYNWGTGRRKTAIARVRIKPGSGNIVINKRELTEYFPSEEYRRRVRAPLELTKTSDRFDVWVNLYGGGVSSQAGAVLLGVARALLAADETTESTLRDAGFLTRDSRQKERKKYGQRGARRSFQFSKR